MVQDRAILRMADQ